ncbi:hypothetical protein Clacol_005293 [Clathrus columnatus]|uniref:Cytochrome P450 n=1 Tax=Clathrus columnatus TaxID=1419009 RepID=A0AAV5ABJ1_9AGAM|nr:hypothetical protein Clacol_005293 [Clathrus columnatus]
MPLSTLAYTGLTGVVVYIAARWWNSRIPRGLKLPPGPPGRLLIGNLLDLPKSKEWLTFDQWTNKYGDLVYLSLPGASLLLVNSYELAKELFDKKGNIYSNRYQSTVFIDILKFDWSLVFLQYGEKWRRDRMYFHQLFNQKAIQEYYDIQMKYTKVLLKRLYRTPQEFRTHVRYIMGASVLEVTYGMQPMSEEDPFLVLSEDTIQKIGEAGIPGTYMVDIFPILKHIPAWFPGAGFKTELEQLGRQVTEMVNRPVKYAKDSLRKGNAQPSAISALIEQFENDPDRPEDYEDLVKYVPGSAYIAAIDTVRLNLSSPRNEFKFLKTSGVLLQFFYTMLLNPEVQKRAQQELDEVVGSDALPSIEDSGRLKYINAILQELLRWNTVVPSGLPHVLMEDDVVGKYFIPKGTIVFGNTWSLLRNKSVYGSDADQFKPERFLNTDTPLPDFAFGYGRRVCPGQHFAENGMFIAIACILHLFDILPFEGENGPELPKAEDFDSGSFLRPKPFKCKIIPRSSAAVRTLEEFYN